jgi:hypothetical protein
MKKKVERKEREKGESGAQAEFESHFILKLGFLFF